MCVCVCVCLCVCVCDGYHHGKQTHLPMVQILNDVFHISLNTNIILKRVNLDNLPPPMSK